MWFVSCVDYIFGLGLWGFGALRRFFRARFGTLGFVTCVGLI